jgi:hypothetical protein
MLNGLVSAKTLTSQVTTYGLWETSHVVLEEMRPHTSVGPPPARSCPETSFDGAARFPSTS